MNFSMREIALKILTLVIGMAFVTHLTLATPLVISCGKCSIITMSHKCIKVEGTNPCEYPLSPQYSSCSSLDLSLPLLLFDCSSTCPNQCSTPT